MGLASAPQIAARIADMNAGWAVGKASGYLATNLATPTAAMAPPPGGWSGLGPALQLPRPLNAYSAPVAVKAPPASMQATVKAPPPSQEPVRRRWSIPPPPPAGPMPAAALAQSQPPGPPPPRRAPPTPLAPLTLEEAAALVERQRTAEAEVRRLEAELAETLARRRKQEVDEPAPTAGVPWIFAPPADGSIAKPKPPPPPLPTWRQGVAASSGDALSRGSPVDGGASLPADVLPRGSSVDGGVGPAEASGSPGGASAGGGGRPKRPPPSGERTPLRCMKCGIVLAVASLFLLLDRSTVLAAVAVQIFLPLTISDVVFPTTCYYSYHLLLSLPLLFSLPLLLPPATITLTNIVRVCVCRTTRLKARARAGAVPIGGIAMNARTCSTVATTRRKSPGRASIFGGRVVAAGRRRRSSTGRSCLSAVLALVVERSWAYNSNMDSIRISGATWIALGSQEHHV